MSSSLTSIWLKFFREAGITNTTSTAMYATTFAENELTEDMVGDLTRDILKEMGITLMGHVLAILKHARAVHQEATKDRIVAKTSHPSVKGIVSPFPVSSPEESPRPRKSISGPVLRTIEHYVQKLPPKVEAPSPPPQQQVIRKTIRVGGVKKAPRVPAESHVAIPQKHKLKVTDRLGILKPQVARQTIDMKVLKTAVKNEEVVPVRRNRRVLPEQEGSYKITMPTGTTPKTKRLLAKQATTDSGGRHTKATVFQRLGNSDSSNESEERKVTISSLSEPQVKAGGSVFSRLGGRNDAPSTVTSATAEPPRMQVQSRLGYRGILKSSPSTSGTSEHRSTVSPSKPSAKSRLGLSTVTFTSANPPRARVADSSQSLEHHPSTSGITKTIARKKKVILIKKSGERQIVYRDIKEEPAPKRTTFDAATRNKFRSDNIAVVPGITSRLGRELEEEEWDY